MSPKVGRPTEDPKDNYTGIRLSNEEIKKLDYCMRETGMNKTDVIREGIESLYSRITRKKERRVGMYSFTDVEGKVIPFESRTQLRLELQRDIVSGDITAYLVECGDYMYQIDEKTYNAIDEM